jgi:hypothetical protein
VNREGRKPSGWVYFIQAGYNGPIKIGFSEDPDVRLEQLQLSSPAPLFLLVQTPGCLELEREYHRRFESGRMMREWFQHDTEGLAEEVFRLHGLATQAEIVGGWCEWCWEKPLDPGRDKFCGSECYRLSAQRRSRELRRRQRAARREAVESTAYQQEGISEA